VGALLVELVTNALKHGFRSGERGTIAIRFSDVRDRQHYVLEVEDDGAGINQTQSSDGVGMQSVSDLARIMNGSIGCEAARPSETRPGTRWHLVLPREGLASPEP